MANTKSNVATGKPAVGGAISVGATTATMPTTADEALTGFDALGYVSEDGLTNETTRESEEVRAWGGDVVLTPQTEFTDTFGFTLIEIKNLNVLKTVFGDDNVTGTLSTGITISVNSKELTEKAFVVDMIVNGDLKRVVIPCGKVTEIGEVSYTDSDAVGYELTVTALPDASGNTHYEYIKTA